IVQVRSSKYRSCTLPMSPSIASIVTPLRSPAVLSMSSSFLRRRLGAGAVSVPRDSESRSIRAPRPAGPSLATACTAYRARCVTRALLHAGRNALLLVLAQLFLRVELPAAMLTLEEFHRGASLAAALLRCGPVVFQRELDRHAIALLHVPER